MAAGSRILGDSFGKVTLNTEKKNVIRAKPAKPGTQESFVRECESVPMPLVSYVKGLSYSFHLPSIPGSPLMIETSSGSSFIKPWPDMSWVIFRLLI